MLDCGVAAKVKDAEHSICLGPMEPSAVRVTGVSTVNVYQEIEWHSPKSMAVGGNGSRKFI